jgi:hypothetical protein
MHPVFSTSTTSVVQTRQDDDVSPEQKMKIAKVISERFILHHLFHCDLVVQTSLSDIVVTSFAAVVETFNIFP